MRRLSEVTPEEAAREAEELREELEAADREAAPLLCQMMAEWDTEEEAFELSSTDDPDLSTLDQ